MATVDQPTLKGSSEQLETSSAQAHALKGHDSDQSPALKQDGFAQASALNEHGSDQTPALKEDGFARTSALKGHGFSRAVSRHNIIVGFSR